MLFPALFEGLRETLTWTREQCIIQNDKEMYVFGSKQIVPRKHSAVPAQTFTIRVFVFIERTTRQTERDSRECKNQMPS
jgi:hypothetical protein